MKKVLLIACFFFLTKSNLFAYHFCKQLNLTNLSCSSSFINLLYHFRFNDAYDKIKDSGNFNNLTSSIYKLNYYWWLLITSNNKEHLIKCFSSIIECKYNLNKLEDNPNNSLYRIYIEAFYLRLFLFNKQYLKAYKQSKILTLNIQKLSKLNINNDLNNLLIGLFELFGSLAYKKYPFFINDSVYKTLSTQTGLAILEECTKSEEPFIKTEAIYFLMKVNLEVFQNYQEAIKFSQQLIETFPENILFKYYHINILLNLNAKEQAFAFKNRLLIQVQLSSLTQQQKQHLNQIINQLKCK